jgi:hypothetical protein
VEAGAGVARSSTSALQKQQQTGAQQLRNLSVWRTAYVV